MFKIEVECDREKNMFTVRVGDRYQDELCWDEAIGCIARLVINGTGDGGLRTAEQHAAFRAYLSRPIPDDQMPAAKCEDCGSEATYHGPCPYASEINNDDTPHHLCSECYQSRALEI